MQAIDSLLEPPRSGRVGWGVLSLAVIAYAGLALYLSRATTFTFDDLTWLVESDGFAPGKILEPHYGHLIATTRLFYAGMLATVGPEELVVRLSVVVAAAATSVLLYALVKRRLGPIAALAPALLVLFLGSTPEPLLPSFMSFPQATAFGLGALLVLERNRRHADAIACLLLVLSVASLEVGLAFSAAAAVIIVADGRRVARLWVFAVPIICFAAWWLWARQFDEGFTTASNVLLIPSFAADSAAAATSALSGLGHAFIDRPGSPLSIEWGRTLMPVLAVVVCWRAYRRGVSRELLGFAALLVVLWAGFAFGYGILRTPDVDRYAYPVAIGLVLLLAEAFRGTTITPAICVWLLLGTLFALPANLYQLRATGATGRDESLRVDAEHVAMDVARPLVSPDFNGDIGLPDLTRAGEYFALVDEYGPIASSPAELATKPPWVRDVTDAILLRILRPRLEPGAPPAPEGCTEVRAVDGEARFPLPPGGALLRSDVPGSVSLSRFGDGEARVPGRLPAAGYAALLIPADESSQPWAVTVKTAAVLVGVCPVAGGDGT